MGLMSWIASCILTGILFNVIVIAVGYKLMWYYFTSPIGDPDPEKKRKEELTDRQLRDLSEKIHNEGAIAEEVNGWFTVRTTFKQTLEGDELFSTKKEKEDAAAKARSDKNSVMTSSTGSNGSTSSKASYAARMMSTYRTLKTSQYSSPKDFYLCRLKGSTLFVYKPLPSSTKALSLEIPEKDDPSLVAVGAISINQHTITMNDKEGPWTGIEGRIFNKRNAICLTPAVSKDGKKKGLGVVSKGMIDMSLDEQKASEAKPIYIFSKSNTRTEDLYLALLKVSAKPPSCKKVFSYPHLQWLNRQVSNMTDPSGLGWFNAFVGRIFLGVNQTHVVEQFIMDKINKKLALVTHPLIGKLVATKADLGHVPPLFSNAMLKKTDDSGEMAFQAHMVYKQPENLPTSGIKITIEAVELAIKIVLAVRIKSLSGDVQVMIKGPPTDRFWWGFVEPPKMDIEIEPVVGSRAINLNMITSFIEKKLREGLAESIVLPNMDDIPFFNTSEMSVRGGIFDEASKHYKKKGRSDAQKLAQALGSAGSTKPSNEDTDAATTPTQDDSDIAETHHANRSDTTPTIAGTSRKSTAASGLRSSVYSNKSVVTVSDPGSPEIEKPTARDLVTASEVHTPAASTSDLRRTDSPEGMSTDDLSLAGDHKLNTSELINALRAGNKTVIKSQVGTAKDSVRKWGVSFVNKRRGTKQGDDDDEHKPTHTTYYAPSPEKQPTRSALQDRLSAATQAGQKTHNRAASTDSDSPSLSSTLAPSIQPYKASRTSIETEAPTVQQPAARSMIVPHVPKRPGVPTSLSNDPPASALATSPGAPVIAVRAVLAPPKVSRGDSEPLLGAVDDDAEKSQNASTESTPMMTSSASMASTSTLVDE